MPKKKAPKVFLPLPDGVKIGDNITYYLNGWHTGRLDKVDGSYAGIHVLGVLGATVPLLRARRG